MFDHSFVLLSLWCRSFVFGYYTVVKVCCVWPVSSQFHSLHCPALFCITGAKPVGCATHTPVSTGFLLGDFVWWESTGTGLRNEGLLPTASPLGGIRRRGLTPLRLQLPMDSFSFWLGVPALGAGNTASLYFLTRDGGGACSYFWTASRSPDGTAAFPITCVNDSHILNSFHLKYVVSGFPGRQMYSLPVFTGN